MVCQDRKPRDAILAARPTLINIRAFMGDGPKDSKARVRLAASYRAGLKELCFLSFYGFESTLSVSNVLLNVRFYFAPFFVVVICDFCLCLERFCSSLEFLASWFSSSFGRRLSSSGDVAVF